MSLRPQRPQLVEVVVVERHQAADGHGEGRRHDHVVLVHPAQKAPREDLQLGRGEVRVERRMLGVGTADAAATEAAVREAGINVSISTNNIVNPFTQRAIVNLVITGILKVLWLGAGG